MSALKRYARLLRPYASLYLLGLGLLLVTNATSLMVPRLIKGAVDRLAPSGDPEPSWLTDALAPLFLSPGRFALALAALAIVLAVSRAGSRVLVLGAGRYLARDLRKRLQRHLLDSAPSFYSRFGTGELLSRCRSDVQILSAVAAPGVLYTFNGLFMFALAVPYLLWIDPTLTLALLAPYPFLAVGIMTMATRVRGYAREAQEAMDGLTTRIQETLAGMYVVKAFVLEDKQAERFRTDNDRLLDRSMREATARGFIGVAATFVGGIGTCIILGFGGYKVAEGQLSFGDLALFLTVMAMVLRPTIYLGWVLSLAQRGLASLDRIDELLDVAPTIASPPEAHPGPVTGAVELRGLSFRYPTHRDGADRRLALEDVSLAVPAGGSVGLAGAIGSGKSTILRAVPRLLEVDPERVWIDGVPVERWDLDRLREAIGYVPQDGYVFSMTLGENVAFGRPEAGAEELQWAVEVAELAKDLDQLDGGLEAQVGEDGVTLSGGQRQRLAIARAVLLKPKVLLLDDALSMVDAETAVAVLGNLRRELPETTVVVAAHRTATLLGCAEVLVLDQGRVVERGAPTALIEDEGTRFGAMHERQRLNEQLEAQ